jgi:hypothetical protein
MAAQSPNRAGVLLLALQVAICGCTNAAVDQAIGETDGPSDILVEQAERGVRVKNRAGRPILNVRITLEAGGAAYVHVLPTLAPGAAATVAFDRFRSDEGVALDRAPATGTLDLTARDTLGNTYEVSLP